jgi:RHS repeat-associated protein
MLPGTGGTAYFNYDPFGRRIRKVFGSATTIYAYDGDNVIEELDASGSVTARYTQGAVIDEPLAMCRGLTTTYFHADGLGSITSLTDGVGQLAASYVYDSFGKLTASTGTITNPFQYTGREFDSETGLYYYRTRYYDPGVGRFLTEDPAGFLSGSIDFYAYVENSPVSFNDPNGLQARGEAPCCTEKFNDALAQVQKALSGPNAAQSAVFNKYKPCFQKLGGDVRVKCGPPLETKSGFVNCGYHDPRIPSVIRVTPMASRSSGGCGPLKATIVHEMVHICYENDVFGPPLSPTEQEKEAFGIECQLWGIDCACARNPKKCGY